MRNSEPRESGPVGHLDAALLATLVLDAMKNVGTHLDERSRLMFVKRKLATLSAEIRTLREIAAEVERASRPEVKP